MRLFCAVSLILLCGSVYAADIPNKYCDKGTFVLGDGSIYPVEEFILDGNTAVDKNSLGEVSLYGYFAGIWPPTDPNGRTESYITPGRCSAGEIWSDMDFKVTTIFSPLSTGDSYREVRRELIKIQAAGVEKILIRVRGKFSLFSDFSPFFLGESVEIIDRKK